MEKHDRKHGDRFVFAYFLRLLPLWLLYKESIHTELQLGLLS